VLHTISERLMAEAVKVIPGGVNSPVRAFKSVGAAPIFYDRAKGDRVWDADGNEYIDFVGSWGPMILGHTPDVVLDAVREQLAKGTSFGAPTELEVRMAETLVDIVPSIEMVRMVSSGTEATMSAIRLARGYTGRDKFVKFDGNYHGHSDALLVAAGSGLITLGIPSTPGVTAGAAADTIVLPYNNVAAVREAFEAQGEQIAAIIVEPVSGNMGVVPPLPGFLEGLRAVCDEYGAVLIFDEVITGFRVALGGAQERYGVTPDLTTLGKIIGGGFPVGVRRQARDHGRARAGGAGLSGRHAVGQPGGDGRRPRAHRGVAQAGRLRAARARGRAVRLRTVPRCRGRRHRFLLHAGRLDELHVLHPRERRGLDERLHRGHRPLRPLLPGDARAGLHAGTEPVRGRVRRARAY